MRRKHLALWLSVAVAGLAAAPPGGSFAMKPVPPSQSLSPALARSSNAFGFDLYQRLRAKPGNLVISPASLSTALTMTWAGARADTAEQMKKVLHLEGTAGDVVATSGQLARSLEDPGRKVVFRIGNRLFAEKTYRLVPAFVELTRESFNAPVEAVDFRKAPQEARGRINAWVEEKTQHRIKDLIPPQGITKETRLVLTNAIYFLGKWDYPFEAGGTRPRPFHLSASETKNVPTMHDERTFRFVQKDGMAAVEIPYKGRDMSMVFLVPDAIDGLPALEASLDADKLEGWMAALKNEWIALSLPKFEIDPSESLSLGEDLKALGMPLAFDLDRANFTGIANPPDPADRLVIAKVYHKGFVRVDEEGTEAAAASAVGGMRAGAAAGGGPRPVRVDRPFLFLIRDNASGLVVFLGRVVDPSAK